MWLEVTAWLQTAEYNLADTHRGTRDCSLDLHRKIKRLRQSCTNLSRVEDGRVEASGGEGSSSGTPLWDATLGATQVDAIDPVGAYL